MGVTKRDAGAAAELIAKGLAPKLRPARDSGYTELLERHRVDPDFRELVEEIARGLGLAILDAGSSGLVLGPAEDSVFHLRLADYRKGMGARERLLHGLAHLGIAAWCYPGTAALLEEDVRRVSVNAVEQFLGHAAERLAEQSEEPDPASDRTEFEQAWRAWLRLPRARATEDGRAAANTTAGRIRYALKVLSEHGLLQQESEADGGTFRALSRYRVQVRELAATAAWRKLAEQRREEDGPCST